MSAVSTVVVPLLVVVMMIVVGLELTVDDFRRVRAFPAVIAAALAAQAVILPLIAVFVAYVLRADLSLAGGLVLVAACPIAAISNYYTMLARANVALAVTLTAFSSVLALVATPVIAAVALRVVAGTAPAVHMPMAKAVVQLLLALLLPVAVGMTVRALAPGWTARHRKTAVRLSLAAISAFVAYILLDQTALIARELARWVVAALGFTAAALAFGYALASAARQERPQCIAVAMGFGARNLGIAMMIAATVLDRLDFAAFAAVFFLVQLTIAVPLSLWARQRIARGGGALAQAELLR